MTIYCGSNALNLVLTLSIEFSLTRRCRCRHVLLRVVVVDALCHTKPSLEESHRSGGPPQRRERGQNIEPSLPICQLARKVLIPVPARCAHIVLIFSPKVAIIRERGHLRNYISIVNVAHDHLAEEPILLKVVGKLPARHHRLAECVAGKQVYLTAERFELAINHRELPVMCGAAPEHAAGRSRCALKRSRSCARGSMTPDLRSSQAGPCQAR